MEAQVYNLIGEATGKVTLSPDVFGTKLNTDLVYQVALAQKANQRKPVAHTKNRGEVSGGGKKPWAQKGTGRARHGSIRSPLWKGGGVAFGPRNDRVYKQKVNRKMAKLALFQILAEKARQNLLFLIEVPVFEKPNTKMFTSFVEKLPVGKQKTLLVLLGPAKAVVLSARNISFMNTVPVQTLNVTDLLSAKFVIFDKGAFEAIQKTAR